MSVKSAFNKLRTGDAVDAPGLGGETYLTRAVKMGLVDVAEDFIRRAGADPNAPNAGGERALYIALDQKDDAMIEMLIRRGASVFAERDGLTFRQSAEKAGMKKAALLANGVEREREAYAMSFGMGGMHM